MSKKKQRISHLIGIRNAINDCETTPLHEDYYLYDKNKINQVLSAIDYLLKEDGITAIPANSKVGA